MGAVSGCRSWCKSPFEAAQVLFGHNDSRPRGCWEDKPFRKLYQRICFALGQFPTEHSFPQVFTRRLYRYLFTHHWILPYPWSRGLTPREKNGQRQWLSINIQDKDMDMTGDTSSDSFWCLSHDWRPGYPESFPQYLDWDQFEWQSWIERHLRQESTIGAEELYIDQESLTSESLARLSRIRRNPLRSARPIIIYDSFERRGNNSITIDPPGAKTQPHSSTSS